MTAIEELKSISTVAREKKGRMDASARARTVEILSTIWKDTNIDARKTMALLEPLHYEALGDGMAAAWDEIPSEIRLVFQQWLPAPTSERDTRRMAFLAASIMEKDGPAALDWLDRIIGSDKGRMNKEVRHILATTVLGSSSGRLGNLVDKQVHPSKALRVLSGLLQVAADKGEKVALGKRYDHVSATLRFLSVPGTGQSDITKLLEEIGSEIRSWPQELKDQLRQQSTGIEPAFLDPFLGTASAVRQGPPAMAEPTMSAPTTIDKKAVFDSLDKRIAELRTELDILTGVRRLYQEVENALNAAEEENRRLVAEQATLRAALDESSRNALVLDEKVKEHASQLADSRAEAGKAQAAAESQRADLVHQIEANSRGRIEEFKTSLGITLSKLVQDLPDQNRDLSQAGARVLLLQFHQFLEMLEEKGIRVRPAKGTGA
jgi:regulator of replication initiation timing